MSGRESYICSLELAILFEIALWDAGSYWIWLEVEMF
jgi:hypothetical protein